MGEDAVRGCLVGGTPAVSVAPPFEGNLTSTLGAIPANVGVESFDAALTATGELAVPAGICPEGNVPVGGGKGIGGMEPDCGGAAALLLPPMLLVCQPFPNIESNTPDSTNMFGGNALSGTCCGWGWGVCICGISRTI